MVAWPSGGGVEAGGAVEPPVGLPVDPLKLAKYKTLFANDDPTANVQLRQRNPRRSWSANPPMRDPSVNLVPTNVKDFP